MKLRKKIKSQGGIILIAWGGAGSVIKKESAPAAGTLRGGGRGYKNIGACGEHLKGRRARL